MFSMLAIGYLFLGGAGAGSLVALCVLEGLNARRRFGYLAGRTRLGRTFTGRAMGSLRVGIFGDAQGPRYYEGGYSRSAAAAAEARYARGALSRSLALPAEFFSLAWPICLGALSLGVLCLVADLGRPEQILILIASPRLSAMTVGTYALAVSLAVAAAFSIGANFDGLSVRLPVVRVGAAVGVIAGLVSVAYTGVLLSSLASVLFWQTWLLPLLFSLSSLSCGIAIVLFAAAFVGARQVFVRPLVCLAFADGALIIMEALCLAAYLAWGLSGEGTAVAAQALAVGDLAWAFWGGVFVLGLAVPFAMERLIAHGNRSSQLVWISALILLGGFALRWCIVGTAAYDLTQMPDMMYGLTLSAPAGTASV